MAVSETERKPRRAASATATADSLFGKVAEAQSAIGTMPKDRNVTVMKGGVKQYSYDYLSESALMRAVRDELTKRGVATFVSVDEQRREGNLTLVAISVTFADGSSGEMFTVRGQGQGADPSDKGVYKAVTGAVRYALWKCFLIPTEGDDPNQPHEVEVATGAPVSISEVIGALQGWAADAKPWVKEAVEKFYGVEMKGSFNQTLQPQQRTDAIKRFQEVVMYLDANARDPYRMEPEVLQGEISKAFVRAFDGLAVAGPEPFEPPIPF